MFHKHIPANNEILCRKKRRETIQSCLGVLGSLKKVVSFSPNTILSRNSLISLNSSITRSTLQEQSTVNDEKCRNLTKLGRFATTTPHTGGIMVKVRQQQTTVLFSSVTRVTLSRQINCLTGTTTIEPIQKLYLKKR